MGSLKLKKILRDNGIKNFKEEYWRKKPLFIKGAIKNVESVISRDEFERIIDTEKGVEF